MRPTVTTRKLIISRIYRTYITPGTKGAVISMTDILRIVQFEGFPGLDRSPFGSDLVRIVWQWSILYTGRAGERADPGSGQSP